MKDRDQLIAKLLQFAQELVDAEPGLYEGPRYGMEEWDSTDVARVAQLETRRILAEVGRTLGRILADG